MAKKQLKALKAPQLSRNGEERYVLCDAETGEVMDDAGGYGYRSASGAHRAYSYKHRDRSQDQRRREEKRLVQDWMRDHPDLVQEISMKRIKMIRTGKEKQLNASMLKTYLQEKGVEDLPVSVSDLLRQWRL